MELDFIIKIISERASFISTSIPNIKWYLFGSILDKEKIANDVDLLIIYEKESHPKEIRNILKEISLAFPLDLIFMTNQEENELSFLFSQRNLLIFSD